MGPTLSWKCLWISALVPKDEMWFLCPQGVFARPPRPWWTPPRMLATTGAPFPSYLPISSTYWLLRAGPRGLLRAEPDISLCPHFRDRSRSQGRRGSSEVTGPERDAGLKPQQTCFPKLFSLEQARRAGATSCLLPPVSPVDRPSHPLHTSPETPPPFD